jgi:hypothetical protein
MSSLYDLIHRMFHYYGFDLKGDLEEGYLLAYKGSLKIAIGMKKQYVDQEDIKFFADIIANEGADRGIFLAIANFSAEAEKMAGKYKIVLWSREYFEAEIGRVVLNEAEGIKREHGEELFEQILGFFDSEDEEETPIVTLEATDQELVLVPVIGMEAASNIGGKRVKHPFKFDLQLVPFYIFDYHCEVVGKSHQKPKKMMGTIGVNGLTGDAERWIRKVDARATIEAPHSKLEPKISQEDSETSATDLAIRINTRMVQSTDRKPHVTVYEQKFVKPNPDAIELDFKGLYYVPMWCIVGTNGLVVIDATSGEVLREEK